MSRVWGWASDVALGVRLAVGGGRTGLTRFALSSIGIGLAVAVLLVMSSIGTMSANRSDRRDAAMPGDQLVAGVSPTYYHNIVTEFRGQQVDMFFVRGTAPDSPKPAGLPALPKEGELYASPALAELLGSDEGALLRPRFPERIVGTLDQNLVRMPGDLVAWIGGNEALSNEEYGLGRPVYSFGWRQPTTSDLSVGLLTMALIGGVVVLLPLFIFVSSTSRIAGAERDRRLSALRLVGAGARQVRRIATAESLVSAVSGLVLGTGFFLLARQFAEEIDVMGERSYTSDVVPNPFLAVVIVVLVPAVSVLTGLFALRRTIIEPLGVVRQSKPVRRRAWWRFGMVAAGAVLMTTQLGASEWEEEWTWAVAGGATLLLFGVPVLLPWLVERSVSRIRGGPPSWVLAIRGLQLDSGTSARVVGGVAVVLAGTIALQTVLLSVEDGLRLPVMNDHDDQPSVVEIMAGPVGAEEIRRDVSQADGVRSAQLVRQMSAYVPGSDSSRDLAVLDCPAMRELLGVRDCQDGDVFTTSNGYEEGLAPGTVVEFREYHIRPGQRWDGNSYEVVDHWTMPADAKKITVREQSTVYVTTLVTPGALNGRTFPNQSAMVVAQVGKDLTSDQMEGIRNSVADFRWSAWVTPVNAGPELSRDQQSFLTIRNTLFAAALFTLFVACVSLLVLAVEHIRERRRPLAVLVASGVPTGVLARSLLWQVTLPIVLGVAVAVMTGLGLAAIVMDVTDETLTLDWPGIALMCAGATAMTLLVSALTLPFLKRATRLNTIRTE